jgi:hypothetical protein
MIYLARFISSLKDRSKTVVLRREVRIGSASLARSDLDADDDVSMICPLMNCDNIYCFHYSRHDSTTPHHFACSSLKAI